MLFNNCRSRPHAQLYGGAFYDLNQCGLQANMATDLQPGLHCCVATPTRNDDIEFAWYCFAEKRLMPDPDDTSSIVRVFFGEHLGTETFPRNEALTTEPYSDFFNVNGHFKRPSAIRPSGPCIAPVGLRQGWAEARFGAVGSGTNAGPNKRQQDRYAEEAGGADARNHRR